MSESKSKVFVSSAQKELEPERLALFSLLTTDPFLKDYVEPVLFEKLPPPAHAGRKPYLSVLKKCQIYVLMLDREYAENEKVKLSPTQEEYRLARSMGMPVLAMVKGRNDSGRDSRTQKFFKEIKQDDFTYKRFIDRIDLKKEVAAWLLQILKEEQGVTPTRALEESSEDTIEAASTFETIQQEDVELKDLHLDTTRSLFAAMTGRKAKSAAMSAMALVFRIRGLLWSNEKAKLVPTAGGVVILGKDPALKYPQCQVLADAYRSKKVTSTPRAQASFSGPIPELIDESIDFVQKNTEHPTRVVGVNNIPLDEYPEKAVREVLVNAFAHRDYEDASRKIRLEIFQDRLVVSSPGYPPKPLTLAKLRSGNYDSCRRNPVIAECLASLDLMEQRGTGFEKIRAALLDHGLEPHILEKRDGYFKVILPGPDGDYDRIRTPKDAQGLVPPSVEAELNDRQKQIMVQVQTEGSVTSGWCRKKFGVSYNTAYRDLSDLVARGPIVQVGQGRSTRYVLATGR